MKTVYFDAACAAFAMKDRDWEPHCVRMAALVDDDGEITGRMCHLVKPLPAWELQDAARPYHKALDADFEEHGVPIATVAEEMAVLLTGAELIVSHAASFHHRVLASLFQDAAMPLPELPERFCTLAQSMPICKLPQRNSSSFKPPKLAEAFRHFAGVELPLHTAWDAHAATQVKAVRVVHHGIQQPRG